MIKLWERTGGYYLFWSGALYLTVGLYCIFVNDFVPVWVAQVAWITLLTLPFAIPPFGRWLNMSIDWDKNMFSGWRKKQIAEQVNKDIGNLPEPTETPAMPEVVAPKDDFDASEATYTVGKNKAGHTQLRMKLEYGSATLTMAPDAVVELIEQLAVTIRKQYNIDITYIITETKETENAE